MSGSQLEVLTSACPLDCPDSCSLDVTIRDGRVAALDGNHLNPITAGFICGKVRHFPELMYGPDRVLYPAVRSGPKGSGEFRRVSWDEALERVASRLAAIRDEFGGEAILPYCYGGSNGWLTQNGLDARFFHRLGASRLARTLCAMPASTASTGLYGKMPGVAFEDYPAARLIVLWGVNPAVTGIHLAPFIAQAQSQRGEAGGRRSATHAVRAAGRSASAAAAGNRPARGFGDHSLAVRHRAGLISIFLSAHARNWERLRERSQEWTFERAAEVAGVRADEIAALAELYADSRPAVIRCGWGLERNQNGGSAIAAVLALPAVAGKFGVRRRRLHDEPVVPPGTSIRWPVRRPRAPATRMINMNRLGEVLRPRLPAADPCAFRLQLQSALDGSRTEQNSRGPAARGLVHRRPRAGADRHGPLCRRPACRPPRFSNMPSCAAVTEPCWLNSASRWSSRWARPARTIGSLANCAGAWDLTPPGRSRDAGRPGAGHRRDFVAPPRSLPSRSPQPAVRFRPAARGRSRLSTSFRGLPTGASILCPESLDQASIQGLYTYLAVRDKRGISAVA